MLFILYVLFCILEDFDTGTEDKVNSRPRFLSSVTNELSRDRQSNRSCKFKIFFVQAVSFLFFRISFI